MKYRPGRLDLYACRDCGELQGLGYMVVPAVWEVAQRKGSARFLCLRCLELRIERPLLSKDLQDLPINADLLHVMRRYEGMAMGYMGHDNRTAFVEQWVDGVMRRFKRSLWERLDASVAAEIPYDRQKVVRINGTWRAFDRETWAEAEAAWTSG